MSPTSPGIPPHLSKWRIPQVTCCFSLSPSRFLKLGSSKSHYVSETHFWSCGFLKPLVWMWTRTAECCVCLHVWRRADAHPLGRKRSMIETIMHLSVFLLTFMLTRCFGDPSHTHTHCHMFDSSSLTRSLPLHLVAVWSMAPSVSHFHCLVFGRLLCSGAVSPYVNIVANLSLHSTATRQSLCWYTEKSVALGCTTTTRLTPENWALFIFTADTATLPILPGLFPLPSVRLWIVPGSPLTSPAGTPTKTKQ